MLQNRNRHNDKNVYRKKPNWKIKTENTKSGKKNEARKCFRIKIGTTIRRYIEGN